jgi:molybdenum storage protein
VVILEGEVLAISITEAPGRKRKAVEEAYLDPIQGIKEEAASRPGGEISMISQATYEQMNDMGVDFLYGDFGENIRVGGLMIGRLPIGTQIKIGQAVLEITRNADYSPGQYVTVRGYAGDLSLLPDRSQARVVLPIIKEIVQNSKEHKMVISTGGGTRSRHVYAIAMELGMPTGIIATLGQSVSEQNALMISTLLNPYGGIKIGHDDIPKLAAYLNQGCIPVIHGMPPYGFWEHPPEEGRLPPNRTDVGAFLLSEVTGAKQCIFIKDVKGLYTDNPKTNPKAEFIPRIGAKELMERDLPDLALERMVLVSMLNSENSREIQIINGMVEGNITRALNGEHVGTIIYKDN